MYSGKPSPPASFSKRFHYIKDVRNASLNIFQYLLYISIKIGLFFNHTQKRVATTPFPFKGFSPTPLRLRRTPNALIIQDFHLYSYINATFAG